MLSAFKQEKEMPQLNGTAKQSVNTAQHLHSDGNSLYQVFHQVLLVLKSVHVYHSTITRKLNLTGRSDQKYAIFDMVSSSSILKGKLYHLHLKRADWAGGRQSPLLYQNCSITHTTFTTEAST